MPNKKLSTGQGGFVHRKHRRAKSQDEAPEVAPRHLLTPEDQPSTRGRAWSDFWRPSAGQFVVALIMFVTGLGLVMGVRAGQQEADFSTMSREDLISVLDTLSSDQAKLRNEIAQLELTKAQLESGVDSAKVAEEEAARRLSTMQILAGTVAAKGPGIRITITDPAGKVGPELVLDAVEELRDAGAEVLEINDSIRVVASTWFGRDAASGDLVVDGVVVKFPLVIEAIGDPQTLEAGARFRGGLVSEVQGEAVGGTANIEAVDELEITATVQPKVPEFTKPS